MAAVITASNRASRGEYQDLSGDILRRGLVGLGCLGGSGKQVFGNQGFQVRGLCAQDGCEVEHVVAVDDAIGRGAVVQEADKFHGVLSVKRKRSQGKKTGDAGQ